nr:immunoglobulin light chain junction region [Macaca mulatta]
DYYCQSADGNYYPLF